MTGGGGLVSGVSRVRRCIDACNSQLSSADASWTRMQNGARKISAVMALLDYGDYGD